MIEDSEYIKFLKQSYDKQIDLYERIIKDKNVTIQKLEDKIIYLENLIHNRDQAIQIYNNQYNYQTRGSDMSNINQANSGDGDNVGNDRK